LKQPQAQAREKPSRSLIDIENVLRRESSVAKQKEAYEEVERRRAAGELTERRATKEHLL
jgi:hypothetical protein